MKKLTIISLALTLSLGLAAAQTVAVDKDIQPYKKTSGVSGKLNSIGSDTLNNLMGLWMEGFKKVYPNVKTEFEGKGSSTAPPALIKGSSQLGPMSRQMKSTEIDEFEKQFGYKPTAIPVAIDALAIYAHKDNPIPGLTLTQVDSIFSSTNKRGGSNITKWGEVGLQPWASKPISLYGRNSVSGTYGYFKKNVLNGGDYLATVKEQPGSSAVIQGVAADLGGLGYSGIGYRTSGVKPIALGETSEKLYEPSLENCLTGDYPLARFLYVYVNKKPGRSLDKLTAEFIKYVLGKEGQTIVVKDGYYPLPASVADEHVSSLKGKGPLRRLLQGKK
jgi:phosphate transport system substrate-binding protein